MKQDMTAKPEGSTTNEGSYSSEDLDEMLEHFVESKKIESDPKLFALLKEHAMGKNKMIEGFFTGGPEKPKSLKDMRELGNKKAMEEISAEAESED